MAETEFHDPERIEQLTALKALLNCNVSSTIQAHLWLSDVENLRELVNIAQIRPAFVISGFQATEKEARIVQKCEFRNFYTFS